MTEHDQKLLWFEDHPQAVKVDLTFGGHGINSALLSAHLGVHEAAKDIKMLANGSLFEFLAVLKNIIPVVIECFERASHLERL